MELVSLCSLYDSENPLPFGQTKRKTKTVLALALENEHQMYLSLSFLPAFSLSYLSFLKFIQIGF